ncbi:MAG: hypothetical protein M1450_03550 [Patescibacteria group bacterium]|nr:hypothetical protein [Patescibacteria group bacterium]
MKEKINSLFASKIFQFAVLVAVVTAVPLTVISVQEKKDTRQQAAELNSFVENCSPVNGFNVPVGQTINNFSGKVYDNVAVSGTRIFSLVINRPDKKSEILDTGITYYRLATDPPLKSGCVPIPQDFTPSVQGKYTWYIIAQIKEYQGQGQIQSKDFYFYAGGGQITPIYKYPTPKPTLYSTPFPTRRYTPTPTWGFPKPTGYGYPTPKPRH